MGVRPAEGLADLGRFDRRDVGARCLHWWREGSYDTDPTAAKALRFVGPLAVAPHGPGVIRRN